MLDARGQCGSRTFSTHLHALVRSRETLDVDESLPPLSRSRANEEHDRAAIVSYLVAGLDACGGLRAWGSVAGCTQAARAFHQARERESPCSSLDTGLL